ncbi:TetR/AcrR family transcriptional regulator [Blastococcus sp. TF02A-35]|uniref:TetR/AcrR family transcriptional regulator n=1 Tax=Blastococcus sp. TF02A-35 TaxID=2559612 RepID=UPI0010740692|nr:TetR/AcrR family transcriptional regulator [Blastococcus sp. TF02A_35]TFV48484.1 TetR/AcrR family transcriptional regulator [Blastococcus sp. TF02A_35]
MATTGGRVNRGPAAASDNRHAILQTARRVMAERGYRVPLSAIAREAGVGQGVLYRHFPTRLDLAFAVFEENFADLEAAVAPADDGALERLWRELVAQAMGTTAFVEMVIDARRSLPEYDGADRLLALVERALPAAQAAGRVDPGLTPSDVALAWRMVFGVVVTATDPESVRAAVDRACALLPLP